MARVYFAGALFVLAASVYVSSAVDVKPYYLIAVPRIARPGQKLDVVVSFFPRLSRTALVYATLKGTGDNHDTVYHRTYKYTSSAFWAPLQLKVPLNADATGYRVVIKSVRGYSLKEQEIYVTVDKKFLNGFIQTDKGMYNPGNTVRYRILSLDQNNQAYKGNYNVTIYDAGRNRIKQDFDISDTKYGLLQGEFKLSSEPVLGEWQISVKTEFNNVQKTFEVRKYVLPRYGVTITPAKSYAVVSDEAVVGTISATYTSGKPVKGRADVEVKLDPYYNSKTPQPKITRTLQIDGSSGYSFTMEEIKTLDKSYAYKKVVISVTVTEGLTDEEASASSETQIYSIAEKIEFVSSNPKTFKPALGYSGYVKLTEQDGTPLAIATEKLTIETRVEVKIKVEEQIFEPEIVLEKAEPKLEAVPLVMEKRSAGAEPLDRKKRSSFRPYPYPQTRSEYYNLEIQDLEVPASGIVPFKLDIPENATSITITARYGKKISSSLSAKRFHSRSESYVQIRVLTNLPKAGDQVDIGLESNVEFTSYSIMIMSRGRVVLTRTFRRVTPGNSAQISFFATPEMGPTSRVVAYFFVGNEVIADGLTFNIRGAFKNKVSMEFDADEVQPGDNVGLLVRADPGSLVATLLLDKSVILLKPGFDLSFSEISDSLSKFDVGQNSFSTYSYKKRRKRMSIWPYPSYGSSDDAKAVFEEAGVKWLTNGEVYDYVEPPVYYPYLRMMAFDNNMQFAAMEMSLSGGFAQVEKIRTRFIETWLWSLERIPWSGQRSITLKAPDTMTTWVGTAFAVDSSVGFGMTEQPSTVVVLQKFFVNAILPYSVKRGEHVVLQANVFNYWDDDKEVLVELRSSNDFDCLDIDGAGKVATAPSCAPQLISVKANSVKSVFFPINPNTLGEIDITITAKSKLISDGLTKKLRVDPEGIPQEYNQAVIVDLTTDGTFHKEVKIDFPPTLVPGSQRVVVKVFGDLLGNTLNGLAKLIRMSYGCGEQNMINFAPTVFVSNYLDSVSQLTAERRDTTIDIIESGYQRQMNYMRHDGSFSAFGNSDTSGSTWLSLFVYNSFQQAKKFIQIDDLRLQQTLGFIKKQQQKDGSFNEPGRVIHRDMQGGSANGLALTAYILAALAESNTDGSVDEEVELSRKYVEDRVLDLEDVYDLTICAYALELSHSLILDQVRQKVNNASSTDGGVHWKAEAEFAPHYSWKSPHQRSSAGDVEATAYALLACSVEGDISRCLGILPWLIDQQNSNGGFVSTQDTVVAVHALSALGSLIYSADTKANVVVKSGSIEKSFTVDDKNRFLLQSAILSGDTGKVDISGTGGGRVVVQVSVRYNIQKEFVEPAFALEVHVNDSTPSSFEVEVCAHYLLKGDAGMSYVEVQIPTGFSPKDDTEKSLINALRPRVEVDDSSVIVYFNEIGSEPVCFSVHAMRTGLVAKSKPVTVTIIDYYEPDQKCVAFYLPDSLADSDFCDVCNGGDCKMCENRRK